MVRTPLPRFEEYYFDSITKENINNFQCDNELEKYFKEDAFDSEEQLISKTYFLKKDNIEDPLVGFSLSNHSIEANSDLDMVISQNSHYKTYPAVLIGRLATHKDYEKNGYGRIAINMIKNWFITTNKTGCRFIIVDARKEAKDFYIKCGFESYPAERKDSSLVLMYFDLSAYQLSIKRNINK